MSPTTLHGSPHMLRRYNWRYIPRFLWRLCSKQERTLWILAVPVILCRCHEERSNESSYDEAIRILWGHVEPLVRFFHKLSDLDIGIVLRTGVPLLHDLHYLLCAQEIAGKIVKRCIKLFHFRPSSRLLVYFSAPTLMRRLKQAARALVAGCVLLEFLWETRVASWKNSWEGAFSEWGLIMFHVSKLLIDA
jgi:hypothetical protein